MIKSRYFWLAAILIAVIPLLGIDITQHYLDWQKDVREELIVVVQNLYPFNKQQKTSILDKVFERNQTLMFLIYMKSFAILILLAFSFYFFRLYKQQQKPKLLKPLFYTLVIIAFFTLTKIFLINRINANKNIRFITMKAGTSSFKQLYIDNFRDKVVYVDFWGTTCGPCLQEFRDFTKSLKDRYAQRDDIKYLYVGQGNEYIWHEQIKKYNVTGDHIFMDEKDYEKLYQLSTNDSLVLMPHYLIIDKKGNIVEPNAKRPSDGDSLYLQLDKYLAIQAE
jgi:thiol-disulfide isomerase/thioredoxin